MVVVIIVSCIPALIRCCTKHFLCITGSENPHNPTEEELLSLPPYR